MQQPAAPSPAGHAPPVLHDRLFRLQTLQQLLNRRAFGPIHRAAYARGYVWQRAQVSALFDDIFMLWQRRDTIADAECCHLGTVVLQISNARATLIDGLQRLTTLAVLLCMLKREASDAGHPGRQDAPSATAAAADAPTQLPVDLDALILHPDDQRDLAALRSSQSSSSVSLLGPIRVCYETLRDCLRDRIRMPGVGGSTKMAAPAHDFGVFVAMRCLFTVQLSASAVYARAVLAVGPRSLPVSDWDRLRAALYASSDPAQQRHMDREWTELEAAVKSPSILSQLMLDPFEAFTALLARILPHFGPPAFRDHYACLEHGSLAANGAHWTSDAHCVDCLIGTVLSMRPIENVLRLFGTIRKLAESWRECHQSSSFILTPPACQLLRVMRFASLHKCIGVSEWLAAAVAFLAFGAHGNSAELIREFLEKLERMVALQVILAVEPPARWAEVMGCLSGRFTLGPVPSDAWARVRLTINGPVYGTKYADYLMLRLDAHFRVDAVAENWSLLDAVRGDLMQLDRIVPRSPACDGIWETTDFWRQPYRQRYDEVAMSLGNMLPLPRQTDGHCTGSMLSGASGTQADFFGKLTRYRAQHSPLQLLIDDFLESDVNQNHPEWTFARWQARQNRLASKLIVGWQRLDPAVVASPVRATFATPATAVPSPGSRDRAAPAIPATAVAAGMANATGAARSLVAAAAPPANGADRACGTILAPGGASDPSRPDHSGSSDNAVARDVIQRLVTARDAWCRRSSEKPTDEQLRELLHEHNLDVSEYGNLRFRISCKLSKISRAPIHAHGAAGADQATNRTDPQKRPALATPTTTTTAAAAPPAMKPGPSGTVVRPVLGHQVPPRTVRPISAVPAPHPQGPAQQPYRGAATATTNAAAAAAAASAGASWAAPRPTYPPLALQINRPGVGSGSQITWVAGNARNPSPITYGSAHARQQQGTRRLSHAALVPICLQLQPRSTAPAEPRLHSSEAGYSMVATTCPAPNRPLYRSPCVICANTTHDASKCPERGPYEDSASKRQRL